MAEKSETIVTKEDRVNEAKELFGRGSRNFCMKQFAEAADDLSTCCAIYSELYGPQAEECGLPYLLYAKSLIALGKDENNLIVPGEDEEEVDDDEDDEDGEEEEEAEGDEKERGGDDDKHDGDKNEAMNTNEEQPKNTTPMEDTPTAEAPKENESAKDENKKEVPEKVAKDEAAKVEAAATSGESASSKKGTTDEPQPGPSTSNGTTITPEDTEGSAGNLQVAWEILELAVKIFKEQGEAGFENLSECYSELAGISFENSHFQEAINDYREAMEMFKKTNKEDLRMLAEVHYKVGLCHLMVNDFDASVSSFKGAIAELDKVIEQEKAKEQTEETKETIEELKETKDDIMEKIADVEDAKKTSIEEVKRELSKIIVSAGGESNAGVNKGAGTSSTSSSSAKAATNGSGTKPAAAAAKPANDISHLIKRKKPDSATMAVEGSPAKKTAPDADNPLETHNTSA